MKIIMAVLLTMCIGCGTTFTMEAPPNDDSAPVVQEAPPALEPLDLVRAACPEFDELDLAVAIGLTENIRDRGASAFDALAEHFQTCDGGDACFTCWRRVTEYTYFAQDSK